MSENPLISIILPIYNIEKYLHKCIETVLNQTYKNLEILMIDDGSQDNCGNICDAYAKKDVRIVVYHKENGGLSDARNYGIKKARGEFITCIDPDDYVDIDYVEYLYHILVKHDSKMSLCQHRVHYNNGYLKENGSQGDELIGSETCLEKMLYNDEIDTSAWAKLYHCSLFLNTTYPKGRIFEDIGTTYALMMQCGAIAVGHESKYNYIFHDNSIVNGAFRTNKFDLLDMTDKMAEDVLKKYPRLGDAVLRRQVYARISTLNQMLYTEQYQSRKEEIVRFIKAHRKNVLSNSKAPKRDKFAIILLAVNYHLYRFCWIQYRQYIMGRK